MNTQLIHSERKKSLFGQYAGFVSRFVAFVIDTMLISIILISSTWFLSATMRIFQLDRVLNSLRSTSTFANTLIDFLYNPITASTVSVIIIYLYFQFFWTFSGSSPGKSLMGLRIVPLNGKKISFWRALLRYLAYAISAIPLGLGFFWIILDDRRMGWHDKIAQTCVIYTWDAHPDEVFLKAHLDRLAMRRDALRSYVETHSHKLDSGNLSTRNPDETLKK